MNKILKLPQTAAEAFGDFVDSRLAAIEMDVDGTIINVNDNYQNISGYRFEELIGRSYYDLLCPSGYRATPDGKALRQAWLGGERVSGCFSRFGKGGRLFWLEATYTPVFADNGWPVGTVGIGQDVTAQATTSRDEEDNRRLLETSLMVAEYTPSGHITKVNQNYLEAFQYNECDLIGQNRSILFSRKALREPGYRQMWDYICAGHSYSQQLECRDQSGQPVWIEGVYNPIFNSEGRLIKVVLLALNVTWRVQKERRDRELAELLAMVCDHTQSAMLVVGDNNLAVYANESFSRLFGYGREEIIGRHASVIFGPAEKEVMARLRATIKNGHPANFEEIAYGKNGQRLWVACSASHIIGDKHQGTRLVAVFTDITDVKMNEMVQNKALEALNTNQPLTETLAAICQEVERLIPEVAVCVIGLDDSRHLRPLVYPSLAPTCVKVMTGRAVDDQDTATSRAITSGEPVSIPDLAADQLQNQTVRSVYLSAGLAACWAMPITSSKNEIFGAVTFFYQERVQPDDFQKRLARVMSRICAIALEREKNRNSIRRLAYYDKLTGLPNRGFFVTNAERMIKIARQNGQYLAVILISVDRMKFLCESLGHKNGDELLKLIAQAFQTRRAESSSLVGRISHDEMALVICGCDSNRLITVAGEIQEMISRPLRIDGVTVTPSASLGICVYPANGEDMETLLRNAALAVSEARNGGYGRFSFFTIEQDQAAKKTLAMEAALRRAIGSPELRLYYQPQISLLTGNIEGAEALLRWTSPRFGQISPADLIPMTENSGLITRLSNWVLAESCRQLGLWRRDGFPLPSLSINLSSSSFSGQGFLELILNELEQNGLTTEDLNLELTESVFMEPGSPTLNVIEEAQRAGLRFSVDDFGTGYSCLSYLKWLPINELKLDRSFTMDFKDSEISRCISQAIMSIGRNLGLRLVAEGVETEDQLTLLKQQGWTTVQGFLFTQALPATAFEAWVREYPPKELEPVLEALGLSPAARPTGGRTLGSVEESAPAASSRPGDQAAKSSEQTKTAEPPH